MKNNINKLKEPEFKGITLSFFRKFHIGIGVFKWPGFAWRIILFDIQFFEHQKAYGFRLVICNMELGIEWEK